MCFTGVVPSAPNPSWTDSMQEENTAKRDDRPTSSHLSTLSGKIQMKKHPVRTSQFPGKCITTAIRNMIKTPFIGWNCPEHKIKDCNSGRRSHMLSSYTVLCQQIASVEWFLRTEIEYCLKDSQPHDQRQKSHLKAIGNRRSSNSSSSRLVMTWLVQGDLYGRASLGQETSEATQRMIKLVQGDLFELLSELLTKSQNSKAIFEWKEYLKMPTFKTKNRWKKSTKSWKSWKLISKRFVEK